MTVLIGKNESGKTATLEALRFFQRNILRLPESAFPLDGSGREPFIEICFSLNRDTIEDIQEASGVRLTDRGIGYILKKGLTVTKNCRGQYGLNPECVQQVFGEGESAFAQEVISQIQTAKERLDGLLDVPYMPSINFDSGHESIQREAGEFIKTVKSFLPSVKGEDAQIAAVEALRIIIKGNAKLIQKVEDVGIERSDVQKDDTVKFFIERVVERLPNFIFFSEFSDILPFEISVDQLKENQSVLDFAKIADLDLDCLIETPDIQKRMNLLNRHSAVISGDFLSYWGQGPIELAVKPEADKILFGVKDSNGTDFFKVEQRSKGFQWFLSFYLRLNAQKARNTLIIIDEPGVHLHAKAQKEIMKILEQKIVGESQVIFSTHCPYLIDTQRLDRVRVVIKDDQRGTMIHEDVHGHLEDESLLPVTTAMGERSVNLQPIFGQRNVILSSMSDYYIWKALKRSIRDIDLTKINLLPATDVDHIIQMVSLMVGYDLDFQVLLNNNATGCQIAQQLRQRFELDKEIIFVSDEPGYTTEDLFTPEDYASYVLKAVPSSDQEDALPAHQVARKRSKILVAKEFSQRMEKEKGNITLTHRTILAFREVFQKILEGFHKGSDPVAVQVQPQADEGLAEAEAPIKRRSIFSIFNLK